jgi:dynein heavy chain
LCCFLPCLQSIYWEVPPITGEVPCPRSGHTFTAVGEHFLLFGGCGRVDGEYTCGSCCTQFNPAAENLHTGAAYTGKATAFNDLHDLDTTDPDEYKWREVSTTNPPPARAKHAAIAVG